jgi:hypothetical protein
MPFDRLRVTMAWDYNGMALSALGVILSLSKDAEPQEGLSNVMVSMSNHRFI